MRKIILCASFGLLLAAMPTVTFASMHGGAPADATLLGRMLFEMEHFIMHLNFTGDAVALMATGQFATAWFDLSLLGETCAQLSPMVGLLFGSPMMALVTFFGTIAFVAFAAANVLAWFLVWFRQTRSAPS